MKVFESLNERDAILALLAVSGLGPLRLQAIIKRYGSAVNFWQTEDFDLVKDILPKPLIKKLVKGPDFNAIKNIREKIKKINGWMVFLKDEFYPHWLRKLTDAPPILFGIGDKEVLCNDAVAIVGARRASQYGLKIAKKFAKELAAQGIVIVSGLAIGIDSAAHEGAICAKGKTIAVKGCGIDYLYPTRNKGLQERIKESGAIITEFLPGVPPEPGNFPRRNRIISGLSRAVVVVEADKKSGSMITARLALEQGRDVMAVPGSIYSRNSKGCHELIKQGAALVEDPTDVLEILGVGIGAQGWSSEVIAMPSIDNPLLEEMLRVLDGNPQHIDDIANKCNKPVSAVSAALLELELMDIVIAHGAGRYSLNENFIH